MDDDISIAAVIFVILIVYLIIGFVHAEYSHRITQDVMDEGLRIGRYTQDDVDFITTFYGTRWYIHEALICLPSLIRIYRRKNDNGDDQ